MFAELFAKRKRILNFIKKKLKTFQWLLSKVFRILNVASYTETERTFRSSIFFDRNDKNIFDCRFRYFHMNDKNKSILFKKQYDLVNGCIWTLNVIGRTNVSTKHLSAAISDVSRDTIVRFHRWANFDRWLRTMIQIWILSYSSQPLNRLRKIRYILKVSYGKHLLCMINLIFESPIIHL